MNLVDNKILLYFAYPEQIVDPGLLDRYRSLLTNDELAQVDRFFAPRHRHQYLITRALVRTSLSAHFPVDPADWRFEKNKFGKPEICNPDKALSVRFNISHTNGLIMCGIVKNQNIGVDVEDTQRSTSAALSSLSSYFSVREIEDLSKLPARQQKKRFFEYWTLKEAYIKARGAGFSIPLHKFSFLYQEHSLSGFSIHPDLEDSADNWQFWRLPVADRYLAAVAINSANADLSFSAVNSVPLQGDEPMVLNFL